jgi:hypothetical protein
MMQGPRRQGAKRAEKSTLLHGAISGPRALTTEVGGRALAHTEIRQRWPQVRPVSVWRGL